MGLKVWREKLGLYIGRIREVEFIGWKDKKVGCIRLEV